MYLHHNIPPISCFVRNEYLYDFEKTGLTECLAFSVKSVKNNALFFQIMTDNGAIYDKIPIAGLCHKEKSIHFKTDFLQLWDCPSYHFTVVQFDYLRNKKCQVLLKDKNKYLGDYLFTIDWAADKVGPDTSFAEYWPEHKCAHIIKLDQGNYAAQPNNRILFADPAWIHEPFVNIPSYKVCQKDYKVEKSSKWVTEDSDKFFYQTLNKTNNQKNKK